MKKLLPFILVFAVLLFVSCNFIAPEMEAPSITVQLSSSSPSSEVIISWSKCKDAAGYGIIRTFTRDGQVEESIIPSLTPDTTSYTDSNLDPDTEYTYEVVAGYFGGKGLFFGRIFGTLNEAHSSPVKIKTKSDPFIVLDYPTNLKTSPISNIENAIRLSWSPCEGANSYKIYIYEKYANKSYIAETNLTEYELYHLFNEDEVTFRVKAFGPNGTSSVLSTYIKAVVPKATNIKRENALILTNNIEECFYSSEESLWFIIQPEEGFVRTIWFKDLMFFDLDGNFLSEQCDCEEKKDGYYWNIVPNKKYLLRVCKPQYIQIEIR